MGWKDYFYFTKNEKRGIIFLLTLISISIGVLFFINLPSKDASSLVSIETENEFKQFEASLKEKEVDSTNSAKIKSKPQHYNYPHQEKLKIGETIELNTSDTSMLKKIPGIGTAYANRIVKYRNLLGGYYEINQLKEVYGLDKELFIKIKPYITLNPKVKKLQINSASFSELNKHPYIDYKKTKTIIDIRNRKGKIESLERLGLMEEFTEKDLKRLGPYLTFD